MKQQGFEKLNQWFKTPHGLYLACQIESALSDIIKELRGDRFLQVGLEQHQFWLQASHSVFHYYLLPYHVQKKGRVIIGDVTMMPIETASLDILFCPFTLSVLEHDAPLFAEINRVLADDGHVIFCGVNPVGLWGIKRLCQAGPNSPLALCKRYGPGRIKKQMHKLGFVKTHYQSFYYAPPGVTGKTAIKIFENMGSMLHFPAGFYMMAFQKQTLSTIKQYQTTTNTHFADFVIN